MAGAMSFLILVDQQVRAAAQEDHRRSDGVRFFEDIG